MNDPKATVKAGYDKVSYAYRENDAGSETERYREMAEEFTGKVPKGSKVLDLGCGCGVPAAKLLSSRYRVTGVDLSEVQIERARALVPDAEKFICCDMTEADFSEGEFNGIVSFYAIIHLPVEEQYELFQSIYRWLASGGYFLVTTGHEAWTGTERNWLKVEGADMFWSHHDRDTYAGWFGSIGFDIVNERFIPEGDSGHTLFLLRKPK
ncbi:SAM-dependent methyltransferase [Paenibacillus gansuensis]|uniref:SAM-dependent methyltransferase n=1 Tax=Paenibacillus gansuensis TaxID=306542 RepID=A0ABW5P921_9BACL